MLIKFHVSNYLSFDDKQTFSMINGISTMHPEHITRFDGYGVLRASAMYGANASGKSNFVKAMAAMKALVVRNEPIVSDKYFRPKPGNKDVPSLFDVEIEIGGRAYSYGFEYNIRKQEVVDEWLHEIFVGKESRVIFERTGDRVVHFFEGQDGERMNVYAEDAEGHPERLFLNAMGSRIRTTDTALKIFADVKDWFKNKLRILDINMPLFPSQELDEAYFERLNRLMASFGTGINEIGYENKPGMEALIPQGLVDRMKNILSAGRNPRTFSSFNDYRISLAEDGSLIFDEVVYRHNGGGVSFHSDEESDGTKKLFGLLANVYADMKDVTFLIDELDARLHPGLTYRFVKLFLESGNAGNKQLLFTTHESSLMDFGLLRRDEIWFTEKDADGASHLYSLEEFNERNDRRIEKAYREGRYGGVPVFSSVFPPE